MLDVRGVAPRLVAIVRTGGLNSQFCKRHPNCGCGEDDDVEAVLARAKVVMRDRDLLFAVLGITEHEWEVWLRRRAEGSPEGLFREVCVRRWDSEIGGRKAAESKYEDVRARYQRMTNFVDELKAILE